MTADISSKTIDGITDLVVVAPIREGFIHAYENITYATRLRIVAEALNRIRVSAREHEFTVPFSDVTERIMTLLDFRIGVLDKDLFAQRKDRSGKDATYTIEPRRFLYLTATFDSAWEPYMRLIWDPLGPFLDLIFCNCEGYVPAGDNSCEDFLNWVRDHQVDSAIFYATSGASIRDDRYHGKIDRLLRETDMDAEARQLAILRHVIVDPQDEAGATRANALAAAGQGNFRAVAKMHELALEVLTVLFRLADFYPPEWLFPLKEALLNGDANTPDKRNPPVDEGKYLARVAYSILLGWPRDLLTKETTDLYREPLDWFDSANKAAAGSPKPKDMNRPVAEDPPHDPAEVQGGVLGPQDAGRTPIVAGALLLLTVTDTNGARAFLRSLNIHFHGEEPENGFYRTVGFTAEGLKRLAVYKNTIDGMPKEFREGMAERSGHLGDMRELHPRRWALPPRNWPPQDGPARPPVDLNEIDIVVQLRHAPADGKPDEAGLMDEIERLAGKAEAKGALLLSYEMMNRLPRPDGGFTDHFGFADGLSQPEIRAPGASGNREGAWKNSVARGDVLLGYGNDRDDYGYSSELRGARKLMKDGTFLVVRKLEQRVDAFNRQMEDQARWLRSHGHVITADELAYQIIGRKRDGTPLVPISGDAPNAFSYDGDKQGQHCPFASHIRRTNPRTREHGRPTPRIVRRGMSYGPRFVPGVNEAAPRGLMFMSYQSSIAEQYEVIQRWINGGNSTGIASSQNDPLLGVASKAGPSRFGQDRGERRLFQFEWKGRVARVAFDEPFVELKWGLYLFVPSKSGLAQLRQALGPRDLEKAIPDFPELLESSGRDRIDKIEKLPVELAGKEWKRLLEDFDAKDPGELAITQNIWSAIRWYEGGAYRLEAQADLHRADRMSSVGYTEKGNFALAVPEMGDAPPVFTIQSADGAPAAVVDRPTIIVANPTNVSYVLANWRTYSVEEQLYRIDKTSGAIYVTQQPDDRYTIYPDLNGKFNYAKESYETNRILLDYGEALAFDVGYAAGKMLLDKAREYARRRGSPYFKLELRRQYLMPALGEVCRSWFGIPGPLDGEPDPMGLRDIMENGGWNWRQATDLDDPKKELRKARCPGDCLSPSRGAFYPRPTPSIRAFAADHGPAIRKAGHKFIDRFFGKEAPPGWVSSRMFEAMPDDKEALARNLIGIMVGAMPPMDGNLRGILVEWLGEKTLWRNQAALERALSSHSTDYDAAKAALWTPMTRAMCKRPAPDLLHRVALEDDILNDDGDSDAEPVPVNKGDMVIVSLVSASQQSLFNNPSGPGDVSLIFGGSRTQPATGYNRDDPSAEAPIDPQQPVHACPAQKMAMGAMLGILTALLKSGRIEALPASLIVKISGEPLAEYPPA
jgi:Dyp-type peroxidase family